MFNQKRYIVWNSGKVDMYDGNANTYDELLETEKLQDCSWSSEIYTSNIKELVQAVYNETDVELKYHYCPLTLADKYRCFKNSVSDFISNFRRKTRMKITRA